MKSAVATWSNWCQPFERHFRPHLRRSGWRAGNWDCATPAPHCPRVAPEVTPGISAFPHAVHAPALCTPLQPENVLRRGRAARGELRTAQQGPAQLLSKLGAGSTDVY